MKKRLCPVGPGACARAPPAGRAGNRAGDGAGVLPLGAWNPLPHDARSEPLQSEKKHGGSLKARKPK